MTHGGDHCFKKNSQIICKEADAALVDPYRRTLVRLNPAGLRVWQLLDGARSTESIIDIMEAEFEVDIDTLGKDVRDFLKELARREMIERCSA